MTHITPQFSPRSTPRTLTRVFSRTCIGALAAIALMGAGGDGGPDENENTIVYQAEIQDSDNHYASIEKILVIGADGTLSASGRRGFDRRNQDRIDYSSTPIFGHLSEHRYDKEDFVEANRIGVARIDGGILAIVLDEGAIGHLSDIKMVALLNRDSSYETRGSLKAKPAKTGWHTRGRQVGIVYMAADGAALALIRPFVVTDSALW